jgi:tetratricopeptide (TPR) repeat protein
MRRKVLEVFMFRVTLAVLALACASWAQPAQSATLAGGAADLVKQGEKLNAEGKQDEALALYNKALHESPDLYEAHLDAGIALDLKGDYAKAREHFTQVIDLAPADSKSQARRAMAMSYAFEGKADEAAKFEQQVFDARLVKNDFAGASGTANELARVYLEAGDADHAFRWYHMGYETALRTQGMTDADKSLRLFRWEHAQARIAARRGKADEAQQHVAAAKAALDKANNPDQAIFFPYLTGYVAFYTGDFKTAIADLQKADQKDPLILALLAEAYEKTGDKAQAMDYYRKVLASNAHNPTNAFARPLAKKKLMAAN